MRAQVSQYCGGAVLVSLYSKKEFQVRALSAEFSDEVLAASFSHTLPLLKHLFTSFAASLRRGHHTTYLLSI